MGKSFFSWQAHASGFLITPKLPGSKSISFCKHFNCTHENIKSVNNSSFSVFYSNSDSRSINYISHQNSLSHNGRILRKTKYIQHTNPLKWKKNDTDKSSHIIYTIARHEMIKDATIYWEKTESVEAVDRIHQPPSSAQPGVGARYWAECVVERIISTF